MKKALLLSPLLVLSSLLILEAMARLFESAVHRAANREEASPGWQSEFFGSLFEWHEPDPDLLWRFKAGLNNAFLKTNSHNLIGAEISKKRKKNSFRMLLLGDSSPVGLGLRSWRFAFGEMVREKLEITYFGKKDIELINAAVSGYTSEQILRFLQGRGWDWEPDVVILYCGNNDASTSGTRTDRELLNDQKLKVLRRWLNRSALYRVMRVVLTKYNAVPQKAFQSLKVRVSPEQFAGNLDVLAEECRKHGCPLVVLKPPVPYLWPAGLQFKPFIHLKAEGGHLIVPPAMIEILGRNLKYCLNEELFKALYGSGDFFTRSVYSTIYTDSLSPPEAVERYIRLIQTDSTDPVLHNNLGVSLWETGRYREAAFHLAWARELFLRMHGGDSCPAVQAAGAPFLFNLGVNLWFLGGQRQFALISRKDAIFRYLDSALQADFFSLRIKRDYWEAIDCMRGKPGVTVIDLPRVFQANGGEKLFIDHCHPTAKGHRLIAEELFKVLGRQIIDSLTSHP